MSDNFNRYAIDTMQSASMKEAKKNGVYKLAEESTLVQLTFGGYLQSKVFFPRNTQPFHAHRLPVAALDVMKMHIYIIL